jgi:streptogramin lyase
MKKSIAFHLAVTVALVCTIPSFARAQSEAITEARRVMGEAQRAYKEKNYEAYVKLVERAALLRPTHPTILYNLAGAYALTGKNTEALRALASVAAMGMVYPAADDTNFASLRETDEFKAIIKRFAANREPVKQSARAFTFAGKGLVTESVAFDEASGDFFVSSVYERKILRLGRQGLAREFVADGLWSVLGLKVDARRKLLWATSTAQAQMRDLKPEEKGISGIFKFDLATGKLIKKYLLPNTPQPHALGDLVIGAGGEVYATDSLTPALYRIDPQRDEIEVVHQGTPLVSPQGLDFTPDGKRLFIADYSQGLFTYDLKAKSLKPITTPPDSTLLGIDGLYFHRGSLVAIQNGVNPQRLIRIHLDKQLERVERWEVLEANHPDFDEPTLGVIVKDDFYYVANSQWNSVDEQGRLATAEKLRDPVILKIKL